MNQGDDGLVYAALFDGRGGAREVGWPEVRGWRPEHGFLWVHLDYTGERARAWLAQDSGVDDVTASALTATEPRPRLLPVGDALLIVLRGVNLNPNADPEDMVAIRVLLDPRRAITVRHRRLLATQDLRAALAAGHGPRDAATFLVALADRLTERIGTVVGGVDEQADDLEAAIVASPSHELRRRIGDLRRDAIELRRYLAPQRDVMARLQVERCAWLDDGARARLRELADRLTRCVEDLESARDRAAVTQEELSNRFSENLNRMMFVLAIVSTVFVPLGLVTGVLGVNVAGVPGTDDPRAFWIVCAGLVALALVLTVALWWWLRRYRRV